MAQPPADAVGHCLERVGQRLRGRVVSAGGDRRGDARGQRALDREIAHHEVAREGERGERSAGEILLGQGEQGAEGLDPRADGLLGPVTGATIGRGCRVEATVRRTIEEPGVAVGAVNAVQHRAGLERSAGKPGDVDGH